MATDCAAGILNTGGNLGGVISTPRIPILVGRFGWLAATSTGSVVALLGAVLWFWIRADHLLVTERFEAGTMGLMCGIKSEDGR